ncbi:diaminopimelate epimerase [Geothrix oryzisoli]|uniref:diaminopimelate epimerase n=1 Tax=Geothrix oryzisoli TaxID=2922721 RepID=UPI001FAC1E9D|nr:diaminopimelate epimerase [Geothrix oryzisoli]
MASEFLFSKLHVLGNDYIVVDPSRTAFEPSAKRVQALCDRRLGIGSDGLLLGPLAVPDHPEAFGLRIFNPDGTEAETSGDGLRIFARYLFEVGHATGGECQIHTLVGLFKARPLTPDGSLIQVEMGVPSFRAGDIPFTGMASHLEVLETPLFLPTGPVTITALSLGNPHCVIFPGEVSQANACRLGPKIERHPEFPERVNVLFVEVVDRQRIRIEIWERGAGYTPASGSSSAAAAACRRLGLVNERVTVQMPGGTVGVEFEPGGHILTSGPVQPVFHGRLDVGWSRNLS